MSEALSSVLLAPGLPFLYVGGDPAVDLINTVDWTSQGPREDRLTDYARLLEWARGAKILSPRTAAALEKRAQRHPREAASAHKAALRLRTVLWRLFSTLARQEAPAEALADFNGLLGHALEHLQVGGAGQRVRRLQFTWNQIDQSLEGVLWPVLWSAASLLVSDESSRLRICDGPECGWMYVDRSRNGLRRWCRMESCGTREKTRRRYHRA